MQLPWYAKIGAKIILSRLPVSPTTWQRLNLFRAGVMDDREQARIVFYRHFSATRLPNLHDMTVLELGPGNGLLSAIFAAALGARFTWLVDNEKLSETRTVEGGAYLTNGLESLKTIPSASVDYIFSNAVLEHVRLKELAPTIREMARILKPSGIMSHGIDFRDHLGGQLNNLRFSEKLWESPLFASSGFYTNRVSWPAMQRMFEDSGLTVECADAWKWPSPPAVFNGTTPDDYPFYWVHALMHFAPSAVKCGHYGH